ncbi:MAG: type II secretion system protein [Desulfamplus sp.]|nr:type II secretion system protein [Desulfamplus sp.]
MNYLLKSHLGDLFKIGKLSISKNHSAFTLLEILVAVMIFGIIMLTIFSSFRAFLVSSKIIKAEIAASEVSTSITNIIFRDFLALRISLPPEYSKQRSTSPITGSSSTISDSSTLGSSIESDIDKFRFIGDETTEDRIGFSRIRFASLAHISFKNSGVARIVYYARPNEEQGVDLCRSDTLNRFDDTEGTECDPVICKNISRFKVTYLDIEGDEHLEWNSESDTYSYGTPVAITIEIDFQIMDSVHTFSTSISMPLFRHPLR